MAIFIDVLPSDPSATAPLGQQAVQHLARQQREETAEGALQLLHRQRCAVFAPSGAISMLIATTPMKAGR
jgi:hypothetical protein